MNHDAKITTDHETIKKWVEERNGEPAIVEGTGNGNSGILRIDFPNTGSDRLRQIDWESFFDVFEKRKLAFLYQEQTADGKTSRFNKFVDRSNIDEK